MNNNSLHYPPTNYSTNNNNKNYVTPPQKRNSTSSYSSSSSSSRVESMISSSRLETTLVSSTGDVLVCRSREVFPLFHRAVDITHLPPSQPFQLQQQHRPCQKCLDFWSRTQSNPNKCLDCYSTTKTTIKTTATTTKTTSMAPMKYPSISMTRINSLSYKRLASSSSSSSSTTTTTTTTKATRIRSSSFPRGGLLGGAPSEDYNNYSWGTSPRNNTMNTNRKFFPSSTEHQQPTQVSSSSDNFYPIARSPSMDYEAEPQPQHDYTNFLSSPIPSFDHDTSAPPSPSSLLLELNKLSLQSQAWKPTDSLISHTPPTSTSKNSITLLNNHNTLQQSKKTSSHPYSTNTSRSISCYPSLEENNDHNKENMEHERFRTSSKKNIFSSKHHQQPQQRPMFFHGTPGCLPHLSQVKVTKISAHPLGSHVLLISKEAILFTYGQNSHGQLGLDTPTGSFISKPTIVVPLLENGGKTMDCAAGVNHSLIVVKTEAQRIGRFHTHLSSSKKKQQQQQQQQQYGSQPENNKQLPLSRAISSPYRIHQNKNNKQRTDDNDGDDDVVEDEDDRVLHSYHHQLYGFGKNDFMKLGLLNPIIKNSYNSNKKKKVESVTHGENVPLPRRVALHCQFEQPSNTNSSALDVGIISVAAAEFHSAALVHRPNGNMEVYTWGKVDDGALGHPAKPAKPAKPATPTKTTKKSSSKANHTKHNHNPVVPIPVCIPWLTYNTSFFSTPMAIPRNLSFGSNSTSTRPPRSPSKKMLKLCDGYAQRIFLGPSCTFVVLSSGKCISFGTSYDGMLGLGYGITKSEQPAQILFDSIPECQNNNTPEYNDIRIASLSVGARHVVALTKTGQVFGWGVSNNGRLIFDESVKNDSKHNNHINENNLKKKLQIHTLEGEEDSITWSPRQLLLRDDQTDVNDDKNNEQTTKKNLSIKTSLTRTQEVRPGRNYLADISDKLITGQRNNYNIKKEIAYAHAGFDNTFFLLKSGHVLSCGRKSGRLGQGEISEDLTKPQSIFGDLRLWLD